jgi:hypothetical protein
MGFSESVRVRKPTLRERAATRPRSSAVLYPTHVLVGEPASTSPEHAFYRLIGANFAGIIRLFRCDTR